MNDDELIERLRRTLQTEAAAIKPRPVGQAPTLYPAPVSLPNPRPRWPLALAAAAIAAAVTLAAVTWPGGGSSRVGVVSPGPATTAAPTTVTTLSPVVVAPVPTTLGSPPSTAPPGTAPPVASAVPAGFAPRAVTFVSPTDGWVAGGIPCSGGTCLALARTQDGGSTWASTRAPSVAIPSEGPLAPPVSVRFADRLDGWVYAVQPTRVWSTHDGGSTWTQVQAGALTAGGGVLAMEAAGGYVRIAFIPVGANTVHVESSPVHTDAWSDADTGVSIGAAPVPSAQLVLQGSEGWLLADNRTVVGGARLDPTGGWAAWKPPCLTANGVAALAASTATDLVAVCHEGLWGPATNLPAGAATPSTWLFQSSDGGSTFHAVGQAPAGLNAGEVASPSVSTVVLDGSPTGSSLPAGMLSASFDGGHTWQTVYQAGNVTGWSDLGFTTLEQGVVVASTQSGSRYLMTRDGGHHWAQITFVS